MLQLLVLLFISSLLRNAEGHFQRVCEGRQLTINCGSKEIDIWSASYGRTQKSICLYQGNDHNTSCHAAFSMAEARHRCQGQQSCTLYATNSAFGGDPCRNTDKYLDVTYKCVPRKGHYGRLLEVCENHKHAIHCHGFRKIYIMSANYGRMTGGHICKGTVHTTNCGASGALAKVRADCHGRQSCVLHALNSKFGDPCIGTGKYLQVRYRCQ